MPTINREEYLVKKAQRSSKVILIELISSPSKCAAVKQSTLGDRCGYWPPLPGVRLAVE
jgi:hypothetical protein